MRKVCYTVPVTRMARKEADDMNQVKISINGKTQWIDVDETDSPDFTTYADNFVQLYKANGSVQPNTLIGYQGYLRNHLNPFFKDTPVSTITPDMVQKYINLKAKTHSVKSITEQLNLLRSIFDAAVEDGLMGFNPCNSRRIKVVGKKSVKVLAYTEDEFKQLEETLDRLEGTPKLLLALSMYTGMRQGEMFALQWTDIDLERSCIHVSKSVEWPSRNQGTIKEPKTENGYRTICIIPQLYLILSEQYRAEGYVLTAQRQKPDEPMSRQAVKRLNDRINAVTTVKFLSHRCRHTVATFMNNAGVDDISITSTLGHADVAFTKRQYMNRQDRQIQRGMDNFSTYLTKMTSKNQIQ